MSDPEHDSQKSEFDKFVEQRKCHNKYATLERIAHIQKYICLLIKKILLLLTLENLVWS